MTIEQLTKLKELSDCFETGIATKEQVEQLKILLAQLNGFDTEESVVVEANGELSFK